MLGSYTAFEVEAQRRREVLQESMRDARGNQATLEVAQRESSQAEASKSRGLADVAASLLNRVGQRV